MSLDVEALYVQEYDALWWWFWRRLGDARDATDDLVADVFVQAWTKRDTYQAQPGVPVRAWLYRIAHNRLVDYWRWRQYRLTVPFAALEHTVSYTLRFEHVDPHPEVHAAMASSSVLTPKQRAVILGRFYDCRQSQELTDIAPLEGVKKLQKRALVNLRKALGAA